MYWLCCQTEGYQRISYQKGQPRSLYVLLLCPTGHWVPVVSGLVYNVFWFCYTYIDLNIKFIEKKDNLLEPQTHKHLERTVRIVYDSPEQTIDKHLCCCFNEAPVCIKFMATLGYISVRCVLLSMRFCLEAHIYFNIFIV